eukprot:TRINITY_DN3757_c0_g3_i1.p1 TRINITY_DN3757_c0_g3~~TRINITY_DN3757_c0_g3_i1.p1  ORF type:complete len:546 (+),score=54.34 TRINITY_DN3757_c0_g3_i1:41-1678(+)
MTNSVQTSGDTSWEQEKARWQLGTTLLPRLAAAYRLELKKHTMAEVGELLKCPLGHGLKNARTFSPRIPTANRSVGTQRWECDMCGAKMRGNKGRKTCHAVHSGKNRCDYDMCERCQYVIVKEKVPLPALPKRFATSTKVYSHEDVDAAIEGLCKKKQKKPASETSPSTASPSTASPSTSSVCSVSSISTPLSSSAETTGGASSDKCKAQFCSGTTLPPQYAAQYRNGRRRHASEWAEFLKCPAGHGLQRHYSTRTVRWECDACGCCFKGYAMGLSCYKRNAGKDNCEHDLCERCQYVSVQPNVPELPPLPRRFRNSKKVYTEDEVKACRDALKQGGKRKRKLSSTADEPPVKRRKTAAKKASAHECGTSSATTSSSSSLSSSSSSPLSSSSSSASSSSSPPKRSRGRPPKKTAKKAAAKKATAKKAAAKRVPRHPTEPSTDDGEECDEETETEISTTSSAAVRKRLANEAAAQEKVCGWIESQATEFTIQLSEAGTSQPGQEVQQRQAESGEDRQRHAKPGEPGQEGQQRQAEPGEPDVTREYQ